MAARMKAYRDEAGNPRPDLDYREVPASVMAEYMGIGRTSLHRRLMDGELPTAGVRVIGRITYFRPRIIMRIESSPAAIRA